MTTLQKLSQPLATSNPECVDMSDLDVLREIIGDARVVCIGESAHYTSEFYRLKDRIMRFLVSNLGFTVFAMESGFPEGLAVDEWVLGGPGDLETTARHGITYRFGECAEIHAQLQWMRERNSAFPSQRVRFCGMDFPGASTSPGPAVRACLARIPGHRGDHELIELSNLGEHAEAAARYEQLPAQDRGRLHEGIADLVDRVATHGDEVAIRCVAPLRDLLAQLDHSLAPARNPRDEFMSSTVRWLLDHEPRIVVSAHNKHVQRIPSKSTGSPEMPVEAIPTMGSLLADDIGADMVVIGTTYGSGHTLHAAPRGPRPFDWDVSVRLLNPPRTTIDALMDEVDAPLHVVDLRHLPTDQLSEVDSMLGFDQPVHIGDFTQAFDALIHVRKVSLVPGALRRLRDDIEAAAIHAK
ncbi:erythromycin esterase family protein [Saccharopolyspora hattusasensis]|uniref:erythromycin esterase family protein n=1 Tax=Saccharopolyspora hattusasensis TaxID=1128679 RepID=UPI003D995EEC